MARSMRNKTKNHQESTKNETNSNISSSSSNLLTDTKQFKRTGRLRSQKIIKKNDVSKVHTDCISTSKCTRLLRSNSTCRNAGTVEYIHSETAVNVQPIEISEDSITEKVTEEFSIAGKNYNRNGKMQCPLVLSNRIDRINKVTNSIENTKKNTTELISIDGQFDELSSDTFMKIPIKIDHRSKRWQPKVKLKRLTSNELRLTRVQIKDIRANDDQIKVIEFNRDETGLIQELSPSTAARRFQERMDNIKGSFQHILTKPSELQFKRRRKKKTLSSQHFEYEETHKRLQNLVKKETKLNKNPIGRRLYSQILEDSFERKNVEIENKPKRARISLQPVRASLNRLAKNDKL